MKYILQKLVITFMMLSPILNAVAEQKVVVVGAGFAGLTAAYRLQQQGINVQIYEARPRVGGRVQTVLIKNSEGGYSTAELGGQSISDGDEAANMLKLAQELGIETTDFAYGFPRLFYDSDKFQDYSTLLLSLNLDKRELNKQLEYAKNTTHSMKEVLNQLFANQPDLKRIYAYRLNAYEGSLPDKLSTYHNIDTLKCMLMHSLELAKKKDKVISYTMKSLKGGNATLALKLAEALGERIHLNKVLQKVTYEREGKIKLSFGDGTTVECDQLILAMPTSVYKDIQFDEKIIPASQLQEIKKITYGTLAKVFVPVKYNKEQYKDMVTEYGSSFFNADGKLITFYFINDNGNNIFPLKRYSQALSVLETINKENFNYSKDEVVAAKDEQLVKYEVGVGKSWVTDPYAQGTYSNYSVAISEELDQLMDYRGVKVKKIFSPVEDKVFFAGEHATILPVIGTMEAAVESGERVVKMLMAR